MLRKARAVMPEVPSSLLQRNSPSAASHSCSQETLITTELMLPFYQQARKPLNERRTSSFPLLLPTAIRFPLSSMAQTELSQSGVTCPPPTELFSGLRNVVASPELGLL